MQGTDTFLRCGTLWGGSSSLQAVLLLQESICMSMRAVLQGHLLVGLCSLTPCASLKPRSLLQRGLCLCQQAQLRELGLHVDQHAAGAVVHMDAAAIKGPPHCTSVKKELLLAVLDKAGAVLPLGAPLVLSKHMCPGPSPHQTGKDRQGL